MWLAQGWGRGVGPSRAGAFVDVDGTAAEEAQAGTEDYRRRYDLLGPGAYAAYGGVPELLDRLRGAGRWRCRTTAQRQDLVTRQATENGLVGLFDRVIGPAFPGSFEQVNGMSDYDAQAVTED